MSALRENWRIILLVVLLLGSAVALFVPGAPPGLSAENNTTTDDQLTNLNYDIELSGGTQLRAPIVGITADGVNVTSRAEARQLQSDVATELEVDNLDVRVRPINEEREQGAVEVVTRNASKDELRTALENAGHEPERIRDGVTSETRKAMVDSVKNKLGASAVSGTEVTLINNPGGEYFIKITSTSRDREELKEILSERGTVRIYAVYPLNNGTYVREPVLEEENIDGVSVANTDRYDWVVRVTVNSNYAEEFTSRMVEAGFQTQRSCDNYNHTDIQQTEGRCMVSTLNGEAFDARGVGDRLATSFDNGEFANDPGYIIPTQGPDQAQEIELNLRAGSLPAPLAIDSGASSSLEPALAAQFRQNSLITGILAVFAVSLVVYARYRRPEVVIPMVVTALSEVFILLGFVAAVQYSLTLSTLAGFIAVIGTGVDDLIIIADEILQQGEVATDRVFQSRFRKAFWVIGAAAATTIVAMMPLVGFPLDDLSGFAIITIVGVLIGVLITRPAYGAILRNLVLDD